jgi:ABC-type nitrate/sulfonate/bicarbonate transport system permease component
MLVNKRLLAPGYRAQTLASNLAKTHMNLTFLGMAMIGLVGYLLDASFGLVQRRVLWWKSTAQL